MFAVGVWGRWNGSGMERGWRRDDEVERRGGMEKGWRRFLVEQLQVLVLRCESAFGSCVDNQQYLPLVVGE